MHRRTHCQPACPARCSVIAKWQEGRKIYFCRKLHNALGRGVNSCTYASKVVFLPAVPRNYLSLAWAPSAGLVLYRGCQTADAYAAPKKGRPVQHCRMPQHGVGEKSHWRSGIPQACGLEDWGLLCCIVFGLDFCCNRWQLMLSPWILPLRCNWRHRMTRIETRCRVNRFAFSRD